MRAMRDKTCRNRMTQRRQSTQFRIVRKRGQFSWAQRGEQTILFKPRVAPSKWWCHQLIQLAPAFLEHLIMKVSITRFKRCPNTPKAFGDVRVGDYLGHLDRYHAHF